MKKILACCVTLLCILLVSCSQIHTGEVMEEHYYNLPCADSDFYLKSLDEYELWTSEKVNIHENKGAQSKMTVQFNGKTYSGEYWYSSTEFYNTYESDFYEFDEGWFSVKSGTNELDSIAFSGVSKGNCSKEECLKIAKSIANKYIDINEYELNIDTDETINYYTFVRKINGLETCDRLSVGVATNGEIVTFNAWMCSEFKRVAEMKDYPEEWMLFKVDDLLGNNFDESITEMIKRSNRNIENVHVESVIMVSLGDSDYGLAYTVEGEFVTPESDGSEKIEPILMGVLAYTAENNSIFARF